MQQKSDHDLITEIHTAIFGTNGQGGCYRSCQKVKTDFYKFRLWVIVTFALALGSGGIGIWKAAEVLGKVIR